MTDNPRGLDLLVLWLLAVAFVAGVIVVVFATVHAGHHPPAIPVMPIPSP